MFNNYNFFFFIVSSIFIVIYRRKRMRYIRKIRDSFTQDYKKQHFQNVLFLPKSRSLIIFLVLFSSKHLMATFLSTVTLLILFITITVNYHYFYIFWVYHTFSGYFLILHQKRHVYNFWVLLFCQHKVKF